MAKTGRGAAQERRAASSSSSAGPNAATLPPDYAIVGNVTSGMDTVKRIDGFGDVNDPSGTPTRPVVDRIGDGRGIVSIAAVVLAAGEASRFGTPKQRLLLPEVLERLEQSPVDDIVVVAGAHTLETPARVVTCAGWKRGPGASLSSGLEELGDDVEAAIVVLADGPDLDAGGGRARDRLLAGRRRLGRGGLLRRRARPSAAHRARGLGHDSRRGAARCSRHGSCRATISAIPAT